MEHFIDIQTAIIVLLLVAALIAIISHRLRVPYTVALVAAGLALSLWGPLQIVLGPEVILGLFLPPLIFEAAFHFNPADLRRNLVPILLLAVPGVLLSALLIGLLATWTTGLSPAGGLIFGALISATDPVAVVALLKLLPVPRRLRVLLEGESLLNDGTAIVAYNVMLSLALTGRFDGPGAAVTVVTVIAGGCLVGLGLGWILSQLIRRVDDYLIETALTTVLAFGSYLLAERLGFSGVLSVVAAGLVCGSVGRTGMGPQTRLVLFSFWEYAAFLSNSVVFLLIGLQINIVSLLTLWQPVLWAVVAALAARALSVYALSWLAGRVGSQVPPAWQHLLIWGGLRGGVSLALALSLPAGLGSEGALIKEMAYGVVLFTLLVQATSVRPLISALRLEGDGARPEPKTRRARQLSLFADERQP